MSVSCKCCVLSGRDLCDGPIIPPEESYRLWRCIVYGLETSMMRRPWPMLGCCSEERKKTFKYFVNSHRRDYKNNCLIRCDVVYCGNI
jgi:hypothetical protein